MPLTKNYNIKNKNLNKNVTDAMYSTFNSEVIPELKVELIDTDFGIVTLSLHIRDRHLQRFTITREKSYVCDKEIKQNKKAIVEEEL
jgi:hypothetical protein